MRGEEVVLKGNISPLITVLQLLRSAHGREIDASLDRGVGYLPAHEQPSRIK